MHSVIDKNEIETDSRALVLDSAAVNIFESSFE